MTPARLGGWWRLWIVVTAAYGVVVFAVAWQSLPGVADIPYDKDHLRSMSTRSLEILAGRTQPVGDVDSSSWRAAPIVLEMANGATFEVPATTPPEQSQEVAKDYIRILNGVVQEKRIAALKSALIWWFLPSMAVLALGMAVAWIHRGFKQ